jgi:hypothetical protein
MQYIRLLCKLLLKYLLFRQCLVIVLVTTRGATCAVFVLLQTQFVITL